MEIKNGLTLSQFVDYLKSYSDIEIGGKLLRWKMTVKYNDFLKKPLKKEMFINEVEEPDTSLIGGFATPEEENEYQDALYEWQAAEKKVIFKGWKGGQGTYIFNGWCIQFGVDIILLHYETSGSSTFIGELKTIGDLFEATNSELETQNIEL